MGIGRLLVLTAALLAASASSVSATEKIRALIPVKNIDESLAPFVVAKYLGYYDQEGLDVDLIAVGGSNEVAIQIGLGNGDIGEATPAQAVIGMQEGGAAPLDVRYFMNVGYRNIWSISVPTDSPIRSMADLKGKKIGVPSLGSAGTTYGKAYLRSNGVDPGSDVSWIPIGAGAQAVTAIQQRLVDAVVFWDAGVARLQLSGLSLRQLRIDEKLERIPDISLIAKQATIKTRPGMLVGFARALSKATDFTLANPAAAVLITWAKYPEAKPNIADPKARLAQGVAILNAKMEGCVSPDVGEKHGLFIEKDWELLGQFLLQEQQLSKPVPASRMFTNELIDDTNKYDRRAVIAQAKAFNLDTVK
jgi:ABC-type nitrate/sulfonate/bicarbonate transport system substrate-binding protein